MLRKLVLILVITSTVRLQFSFEQRVSSIPKISFNIPTQNLRPVLANNPILADFHRRGVMISDEPKFDVNRCQPEWTSFGTYCDFESLKSMVERDNIKVAMEQGSSIDNILSMETQLKMIQAEYEKLSKRETLFARLNSSIKTQFNTLFSVPSLDNSTLQSQFDKCWNKMKNMRTSAVCQLCSGRGSSFFTPQNPNIISAETCSTTMNLCRDSILNLGRVSEITSKFYALFSSAQTRRFFSISSIGPGRTSKIESLIKLFCSKDSPFSSCSGVISATGTFDSNQNWACSKFLRLSSQTLLEEINPQIKTLVEVMKYFRAHLRLVLGEISYVKPIYMPYATLVDDDDLAIEEESVSQSFSGDTIIMQQSADFSSLSSLSGKLPLNVTLSFP